MFGGTGKHAHRMAKLDALERSQAIIEFQPDGTILTANANFLTATGYTLSEVQAVLASSATLRTRSVVRAFMPELFPT